MNDELRHFFVVRCIIIWLALRAGKMNQIARCDWLPAVFRMKNFPESHVKNPLLTKFVPGQNGWILASFFFCEFMDRGEKHAKKAILTWNKLGQ